VRCHRRGRPQVAVLDFVTPTPQGNAWGLGGTCVNVGCIPKKLMHQAGILGEGMADARSMGWKVGKNVEHDWETLVSSVQDHIGGLNWGYRVALRDASVEYINARGKFVGPHEIECTNRKGTTRTITARRILIAVGGRPSYLGVPGDKECCITSDDVFSLPTSPGKTLIIGGSYIALETAGLLTALGLDVTVVVRSIFLRGFDQEVSEQIVKYMENHGTKFIRRAVPTKFEKTEEGKVKATLHNLDMGFDSDSDYDTVMLAVGRQALTKELGLETCGVETVEKNGKIDAPSEQTNVPHIYAIGDVLESRQELTPVAIKAGVLLAKRLYNGGTISMEYDTVPTTVFTPLEYGTIGISEEDAVKKYGADNVEVYIQYFKPLEWSTNHEEHEGKPHREDSACMSKLVCNLADDERVVGFHYLGPNAAEVTQGFAVGMKMGATKADFDRTVGIHPSTSETFTTLDVTKRSGKDPKAKGC
jgi:thioredoxin reductase (NADPH)